MAEYIIQDTTLTGIADAIRSRTDSAEKIPVSQMAARIAAIPTGGNTGGSGSLPAGMYLQPVYINAPVKYQQLWFMLGGTLYSVNLPFTGNGNLVNLWKYSGSSWTQVISTSTSIGGTLATTIMSAVEWRGKLYFSFGYSKEVAVCDGTSIRYFKTLPEEVHDKNALLVYQDQLLAYSCRNGILYRKDETEDTWTEFFDTGFGYDYDALAFVVNDTLYLCKDGNVYDYADGAMTLVRSGSSLKMEYWICGNRAYYFYGNAGAKMIDLETFQEYALGDCFSSGTKVQFIRNDTIPRVVLDNGDGYYPHQCFKMHCITE